jgi:hypothetical protein
MTGFVLTVVSIDYFLPMKVEEIEAFIMIIIVTDDERFSVNALEKLGTWNEIRKLFKSGKLYDNWWCWAFGSPRDD